MPTPQRSAAQQLITARQHLAPLLARTADRFVPRVDELVQCIFRACAQSADVALAMIQLDLDAPYTLRHPINVAVVVNLALLRLGQSDSERWHYVAAALTMNIGMFELQNQLVEQSTPLTSEQKHQIQQHPALGRDQLRELGVADAIWLDCVAQHHEAPDGSGYPLQLCGDAVLFGARLIGLADRYCALLSSRTYRSGLSADIALQNSLDSAAGSLDQKLAQLFRATLGSYPPGAVVALANEETGVVLRQGCAAPIVLALFNAQDQLHAQSPTRDTQHAQFRVVKVLDSRIVAGAMSLDLIWGKEAAY